MENKHIILKDEECYKMMTGSPILNGEEAEELVYYYLRDKYKDNLFSIILTRDIEPHEEMIREQVQNGDVKVITNDGKVITNEVKAIGGVYPNDFLCIDVNYKDKEGYEYDQNESTCDDLGWLYHMYYSKIYVYRCGNSWYNCKLYCINKPFRLQKDIKLFLQQNKDIKLKTFYNYYYFKINTKDKYKNTNLCCLDLNNKEAREKFDIDVIELDIRI